MTELRIATFNPENLDDKPNTRPTLVERIAVLRPQLLRLRADVLCLQEIHGQEVAGQRRQLRALEQLVEQTPYASFQRVSTLTTDGQVFDQRNLVILSRFEITASSQHHNDLVPPPIYQQVTRVPREPEAQPVRWERPILHAAVTLPDGRALHIINVHLKSRLPTNIEGQKAAPSQRFSPWRTADGWAEGSFLSAMKRVGQALEVRRLIDQLFDADPDALIAVCGDCNADEGEVPVAGIQGRGEDTQNPDLAHRVMVPCERSVPEPARYSLLHHGRPAMLDHVIVSRGLLAHYRTTQIFNEVLHDESVAFATDRLYPDSDHAPVVAEFELP